MGSTALMHFRRHVDMENPKAKSPYALSLVLRHVSANRGTRDTYCSLARYVFREMSW